MATESELRSRVATFLISYLGITEGSAGHRELINIFNNSGLCTRYQMTVNDAWCAMAVSDCFIGTDLTSIFPCVECSCANMTTLAKNAGIWQEDDAYVPTVGDVVMYDWQDATGSKSDNTGVPDHVGVVTSVSGSSFKVIEGNHNDTVAYRTMTVNGSYIRGFITPNYASAATVAEGWVLDSVGWWYRYKDGSWPANQWKVINHHWYWFGTDGYVKTGWRLIYDEWYYLEGDNSEGFEGACWHEKAGGTGAMERWYVD